MIIVGLVVLQIIFINKILFSIVQSFCGSEVGETARKRMNVGQLNHMGTCPEPVGKVDNHFW